MKNKQQKKPSFWHAAPLLDPLPPHFCKTTTWLTFIKKEKKRWGMSSKKKGNFLHHMTLQLGPTEAFKTLCLFFLPTKWWCNSFQMTYTLLSLIIILNAHLYICSHHTIFPTTSSFRFISISNPSQEKALKPPTLCLRQTQEKEKDRKKKWQDLTPTRSRMHRANFILGSHGLNIWPPIAYARPHNCLLLHFTYIYIYIY